MADKKLKKITSKRASDMEGISDAFKKVKFIILVANV